MVTNILCSLYFVALFQPDGQRLCVQADQQLYQLFCAWRPKGGLTKQRATAFIEINCTTTYLFNLKS